MDRCEYCAFRNSWDCDDGWDRKDNNVFCDDFKLDFNQLDKKLKKKIQCILMGKSEESEWI